MNHEGRPLVGIPVKPFGVAKQRLHLRLDPATRSVLGRRIAARTAATVADAAADVVIIAGDSGVRRWAANLELETIGEPDAGGLNGAAAALRDHAISGGRAWMVLHADLPLISDGEMRAVLEPLRAGAAVVAPSHDGGTSALGGTGRLDFRCSHSTSTPSTTSTPFCATREAGGSRGSSLR
jgi:2-phospho-L-lactate guanylyltransferase (CobY/MobA/RfbA family)